MQESILPMAQLRIVVPEIPSDCMRCGCEGEFKNEETGETFVVTGAPYGELGYDFLVSDRSCFCSSCTHGCESLWIRKMRASIIQQIKSRARMK